MKDLIARTLRQILNRNLRDKYLEQFSPFKPLFDKACARLHPSESHYKSKDPKAASFGMLTKNALQNVVEYFRPWGRDFIVLRGINKRVKAAYHDHLKRVVNLSDYM